MEALINLINPETIIKTLGTVGVITVVFMETGLFFGFFLPGDSLLFTAGFLASQGYVSFPWLLIGTFIAAVAGDSVGYAFGKKVGPALFTREESVFFNKKHVARAQHFYEKYGKKTIVLARFVPIVRTFAPIMAGIGSMPYSTFLAYNVAGGFLWTWLMLWLGYGLGTLIPDPDRFVLPIVVVIILVSAAAPLKEIWKNRHNIS
ncbi:MAG: DedA family protein [Candidatus Paceibacterota bacterium]|jgi:membrane-associated protein